MGQRGAWTRSYVRGSSFAAGATRRAWVMDVEDGETARASPRSTKSIAVGPSSPRSEINEDVEAGGRRHSTPACQIVSMALNPKY